MPEFIKIDEVLNSVELVCKKADETKYDFNRFVLPSKFIKKIHNYEITLNEAGNDQTELNILINKLNNYNRRNAKKVKEKNRDLEAAKN